MLAAQVTVVPKRLRKRIGKWDDARPTALGRVGNALVSHAVNPFALPDRLLHLELAPFEFDVNPSQRQHLAATQSCVTAQEHDQQRPPINGARRFDESVVIVEVVELGQSAAHLEHGHGARNLSMTFQRTAVFSECPRTPSTLLTVFR